MSIESYGNRPGLPRSRVSTLLERLPADPHPVSHAERGIAVAGGFIGLVAVQWISGSLLDHQGATLIVASMGASAVLLFAVPHGALSQPWPVLGGHLISAAIGVACAKLLPDPLLAGPLAVALAIGAMQYLRCLHPPGGASALTAVIGGPAVQALGWGFVAAPVLLNAVVLTAMAMAINYALLRRRVSRPASPAAAAPAEPTINHCDLVYALSQIDAFIDVEEADLLHIYALAMGRHEAAQAGPPAAKRGAPRTARRQDAA